MKKKTKLFIALGVVLLLIIAAVAAFVLIRATIAKPLVIMPEGMPNGPSKTYQLENATDEDKFMKMTTVVLYEDGTAALPQPPISSFFMPMGSKYSIEDGELLVYMEDLKEPVAVFTVEDSNTLVFKSSTVSLFTEEGARFVYDPQNALEYQKPEKEED